MKAISVLPGEPGSVHVAELPKPTLSGKRLENYPELFQKLTMPNGAIKVYCEVASDSPIKNSRPGTRQGVSSFGGNAGPMTVTFLPQPRHTVGRQVQGEKES
jgi:hypothetical protein